MSYLCQKVAEMYTEPVDESLERQNRMAEYLVAGMFGGTIAPLAKPGVERITAEAIRRAHGNYLEKMGPTNAANLSKELLHEQRSIPTNRPFNFTDTKNINSGAYIPPTGERIGQIHAPLKSPIVTAHEIGHHRDPFMHSGRASRVARTSPRRLLAEIRANLSAVKQLHRKGGWRGVMRATPTLGLGTLHELVRNPYTYGAGAVGIPIAALWGANKFLRNHNESEKTARLFYTGQKKVASKANPKRFLVGLGLSTLGGLGLYKGIEGMVD